MELLYLEYYLWTANNSEQWAGNSNVNMACNRCVKEIKSNTACTCYSMDKILKVTGKEKTAI